ncbi:Protein of unknown function [Gryllus bimaculatus]|nr:Protein of unknown function [Gryllus bimaculatus]
MTARCRACVVYTTLRGCAGAWGPPTLLDQELMQRFRCSDDRTAVKCQQLGPPQAHSHRGAPVFLRLSGGLRYHKGTHTGKRP